MYFPSSPGQHPKSDDTNGWRERVHTEHLHPWCGKANASSSSGNSLAVFIAVVCAWSYDSAIRLLGTDLRETVRKEKGHFSMRGFSEQHKEQCESRKFPWMFRECLGGSLRVQAEVHGRYTWPAHLLEQHAARGSMRCLPGASCGKTEVRNKIRCTAQQYLCNLKT